MFPTDATSYIQYGFCNNIQASLHRNTSRPAHDAIALCGTTAELWLPVTTSAVEHATPAAPEKNGEAIEKITVLVVDDDTLVATSTVDMLEDLGHEVIEANSGAIALHILRDHRAIDLLITDYSMPRMNGAQLAAAARKIRPDLPILLSTGYAGGITSRIRY